MCPKHKPQQHLEIQRAQNPCHNHMLINDTHDTVATTTLHFEMLLWLMLGAYRKWHMLIKQIKKLSVPCVGRNFDNVL